MPVYDTNRTTATVVAGKELIEDKGGKLTTKTGTQTLEVSELEDVVITASGVVS